MKKCEQCKRPKPLAAFKVVKGAPGRNCESCRRANRNRHIRSYYRSLSPDERFRRSTALRVERHGVRAEPYKRSEVFDAWGHRCIYCNAPASHLEHIIPLSRGGDDVRENVAPACSDCNLSKGDKTLVEWALESCPEIDPGPPF